MSDDILKQLRAAEGALRAQLAEQRQPHQEVIDW
jgi:hypothetical protein